jgi:AraC-like DNA-binding protein
LLDQLAECATTAQRVAIVERFLRPLEPSDKAEKAIARLTHGDLSVDAAALDSGISARQLRRVCLERSGVSPKYLTRILRFRRAAERIHGVGPGVIHPNWAEFAVDCGYFDQAHFIREFEEFAGCTPGRYLQSLPPRTA